MGSHDFKTRTELDEYLKCLKNIEVGDEVEFYVRYVNPDYFYTIDQQFSSIKTSKTDKATVIMAGPDLGFGKFRYTTDCHIHPNDYWGACRCPAFLDRHGPHIIIASASIYLYSWNNLNVKFKNAIRTSLKMSTIRPGYKSFAAITNTLLIKSITKAK